jgi:hypothetical protein
MDDGKKYVKTLPDLPLDGESKKMVDSLPDLPDEPVKKNGISAQVSGSGGSPSGSPSQESGGGVDKSVQDILSRTTTPPPVPQSVPKTQKEQPESPEEITKEGSKKVTEKTAQLPFVDTPILRQEAFDYYQKGKHELSSQIADQILAHSPDDPYALQLKAHNQISTDDPAGATVTLSKAINVTPNNPDLYALRAEARKASRDYDDVDVNADADTYIKAVGGDARGDENVALNLAKMYAIKGDDANAKKWQKTYHDLNFDRLQATGQLPKQFMDYLLQPIVTPVKMAIEGGKQIAEGLGELNLNAPTVQGLTEGVPKIIGGAVDAWFASIGYNPAMLAFNAATSAGEAVGANDLIEWGTAPVSKILQGNGVDLEKLNGWEKLGVKAGDFLPMLLAASASKSVKDIGKKLANKEPLEPQEVKQVDEALPNITQVDVGKMAENVDGLLKEKETTKDVQDYQDKHPEQTTYSIKNKLYTDKDEFLTALEKGKKRGVQNPIFKVNNDPETADKAVDMFKPKVEPAPKEAPANESPNIPDKEQAKETPVSENKTNPKDIAPEDFKKKGTVFYVNGNKFTSDGLQAGTEKTINAISEQGGKTGFVLSDQFIDAATQETRIKNGFYDEQPPSSESVTPKSEPNAGKTVEPETEKPKQKETIDGYKVSRFKQNGKDMVRVQNPKTNDVMVTPASDATTNQWYVDLAKTRKPNQEIGLPEITDIVKNSTSIDDARETIKQFKNVSPEVAKEFKAKYDPENKLTPEQAFEKFYNEVKTEQTDKDIANKKQAVKDNYEKTKMTTPLREMGSGKTKSSELPKEKAPETKKSEPVKEEPYNVDQAITEAKTKKKGESNADEIESTTEKTLGDQPDAGTEVRGRDTKGKETPGEGQKEEEKGVQVPKGELKKEAAKQKMQEAADAILSKWGAKKDIMPEEKTKLWDDLKKFAEGFAEYSAQEVMDFMRTTFKPIFDKLGLTDKERADVINDAVKERIKDQSLKKAVVQKNVEEQFGTEALETLNEQLQDTDTQEIYNKAKYRADASKDSGLAEAKVVRDRVNKNNTGSSDDAAVMLHSMAVMDDMKVKLNDEIRDLPDGKEKADKQNQLLKINSDILDNDLAIAKCGREASNVFRLFQAYLDNQKSLTYMEREYKNSKGLKELSPEQAEEVRKAYDEAKKWKDKVKELEDKAEADRRKEEDESKFEDTKKNSGRKKPLTDEEKQAKKSRIVDIASRYPEYFASKAGIIKMLDDAEKPDVKKDLKEVAGLISDLVSDAIRKGAKNLEEAIGKVFDDLGGKVDKQTINDAFSGELGKTKPKTKSQLQQKLADAHTEAKLVTKLDKLDKEGLPEKSTAEKKTTDRIEDLRKQVKAKEDELKAPEKQRILSEKEKEREAKKSEREKQRDAQKIENEKARKQKVIDGLKQEILDLQKGIDTRKQRAESKVDPEIKALREKRNAEKKKLGISDEEWNKREIARLNKITERVNDDIKNNRFEKVKPQQRERFVTTELEEARAQKANADFKWAVERYKDMMSKRSGFEKFIDKAIKIRTAFGLLSGIKTLGKLLEYTAVELVYKEPENLVLTALTKVILPGMSKKSLTQGYFNISGIRSASKDFTTLKTYKDAVSYLTSDAHTHELYARFKPGAEMAEFKSEVSGKLGGLKFRIPSGGSLHGVEKYPLWKYTFDKTTTRLLNHYAQQLGVDALEDPALRKSIDAFAADVANRRILMNQNPLTSWLKMNQQYFYRHGTGGKIAYYATKTIFAIVNVPTNIARAEARGVSGLAEFAIRTHMGFKSLEKMSPEDCENSLFAFKQGLSGIGMGIGLALASNTVTYDPKTHKTYVLGWELPNWMQHHPQIAIVVLCAEAKAEYGSKHGNLLTATEAMGLGIARSVPFLDDRTIGMLDSPSKLNTFVNNLAISFMEPQLMKDIASWTDPDYSERQAKTFKEHIQMGIPGQSEEVPLRNTGSGSRLGRGTGRTIKGRTAR